MGGNCATSAASLAASELSFSSASAASANLLVSSLVSSEPVRGQRRATGTRRRREPGISAIHDLSRNAIRLGSVLGGMSANCARA